MHRRGSQRGDEQSCGPSASRLPVEKDESGNRYDRSEYLKREWTSDANGSVLADIHYVLRPLNRLGAKRQLVLEHEPTRFHYNPTRGEVNWEVKVTESSKCQCATSAGSAKKREAYGEPAHSCR